MKYIINQNKNEILPVIKPLSLSFSLHTNTVRYDGFNIGYYKTSTDAKTAFEGIIDFLADKDRDIHWIE